MINKDTYNRLTCRHPDGKHISIIETKQLPKTRECELVLERLAELEDKIMDGTLIELPCKIGDTIYQIYKDCSNCPHFKENDWEYDCWCGFDDEESKTIFEFDCDKDCIYTIEETEFTYNHIKDFGKDLFLTKAEAEAKLEKLKGNK